MADNEGSGIGVWTVVKAVLFTAGAIYLVSLFTWFAQWATVAIAIGGVGFLGYKFARGLSPKKAPKQLGVEQTYQQRLLELEREEKALDQKIGIR